MDTPSNGRPNLVTIDSGAGPGNTKDAIVSVRSGGPPPPTPTTTDPWIYRMVVAFLGTTVVLTVAGIIMLAGKNLQVPEGFIALGSAVVGGLAGFLAPSPIKAS